MRRETKELEEDLEYYRREEKRQKKRGVSGKSLLFLLLFAGAILAVLFSPIFSIKEINIEGIRKYSVDEICELTGFKEGVNIFSISTGKAEDMLEDETYIDSASIVRELPNKLNITINERRVRGYIPYMGSYLYIDEFGRVLEINSAVTEPLPVVTGLEFSSFTLGERIDCDNSEVFDIVVTIAQVMTKYEMLDTVVRIDLSNTDKIMAYVRKIEINLGDGTNCDEKIRTMSEAIKQIPENDRGTLDLSDMSKPIVFKYLT